MTIHDNSLHFFITHDCSFHMRAKMVKTGLFVNPLGQYFEIELLVKTLLWIKWVRVFDFALV